MTTNEPDSQPGPSSGLHGRFGLFLTVLTLGFIVSGFGERWASIVGLVMSALLAIIAYRNSRTITDGRWVAVLCALSVISTLALWLVADGSTWLAVPMFLQAGMLTSLVAVTMIAALRRHHVDLQTILAAISGYVLIGLAFAWAYVGIAILDSDQFSMSADDPTQFFEFSFVVQTTLGFGDELPTAPFAARVVVTQAVIGQMFLATLVARLVSLYGRTRVQPTTSDQP